jgi:hypothetical protein
MAGEVQTSYSERMAPPSPGTISGTYDKGETGICETASPGIPFGRAVSQGTLSDQGVILGGTLAAFRGVSIRDITLGAEQDAYLPPNNVGVYMRGQIWVEPGEAVTADSPVYFNGATGVFYMAATGGALGPIKGARWKTSCGIGGRAVLDLSGYAKNA